MKDQILDYLRDHPGARKPEIAGHLGIWRCPFDFLAAIDDLYEDGLIRYETYRDIGNMEYYDKWYVIE